MGHGAGDLVRHCCRRSPPRWRSSRGSWCGPARCCWRCRPRRGYAPCGCTLRYETNSDVTGRLGRWRRGAETSEGKGKGTRQMRTRGGTSNSEKNCVCACLGKLKAEVKRCLPCLRTCQLIDRGTRHKTKSSVAAAPFPGTKLSNLAVTTMCTFGLTFTQETSASEERRVLLSMRRSDLFESEGFLAFNEIYGHL